MGSVFEILQKNRALVRFISVGLEISTLGSSLSFNFSLLVIIWVAILWYVKGKLSVLVYELKSRNSGDKTVDWGP